MAGNSMCKDSKRRTSFILCARLYKYTSDASRKTFPFWILFRFGWFAYALFFPNTFRSRLIIFDVTNEMHRTHDMKQKEICERKNISWKTRESRNKKPEIRLQNHKSHTFHRNVNAKFQQMFKFHFKLKKCDCNNRFAKKKMYRFSPDVFAYDYGNRNKKHV